MKLEEIKKLEYETCKKCIWSRNVDNGTEIPELYCMMPTCIKTKNKRINVRVKKEVRDVYKANKSI